MRLNRLPTSVGMIMMATAALGASLGQAQDEPRAPLANAFGRFWGIGWSAGYHARSESRYGIHRHMPTHNVVPPLERGAAASQHLGGPDTFMYPGNAPNGFYGHGYAMPMSMGPVSMGPMSMGTTMAPGLHGGVQSGAMPPAVSRPVEPPPSWLKQYIKPEPGVPSDSNDNRLDEKSPSDRRGVNYSAQPPVSYTLQWP